MNTPLKPEGVNYNSTTPQTEPRWFKFFPEDFEGYCSPFLPLVIVFAAYIVLLIHEFSFLRERQMALVIQDDHLATEMQRAETQGKFIEGLHSDLMRLAPDDPAAGRVLKDFFSEAAAADELSKSH